MYTISEFSRLTATSAHTIRYYEKEGLLFPKRKNGHRRYNDQDVTWFRFVLRLRETHMPIDQIRSYVSLFLAQEEQDTTQERLALLEAHHANVVAQLEALQETERMISEKIDTYRRLYPTIPNQDSLEASSIHAITNSTSSSEKKPEFG
ncbi:MerR family transcriptional regulator [Exiguobacterium sp. CH10]|uniref:MerR family transcriptional regulator n=1 Tax=Exiguobacterium sp. CH10 TaxID=2751261 RepID=UPI001BEAA510|nr:MerR family transcriptional regulator [Exiguobacterium sp. CH10]